MDPLMKMVELFVAIEANKNQNNRRLLRVIAHTIAVLLCHMKIMFSVDGDVKNKVVAVIVVSTAILVGIAHGLL